jgi:hypothetical protein
MNSFKKKIQKTAIIASMLLFLNQNLLCEEILKTHKPTDINSSITEYSFDDKKMFVLEKHIHIVHNCETYLDLKICDNYDIELKESEKIINHKVFEVEIKKQKYLGILVLFKDSDFGFYIFDKKLKKTSFFVLEKFDKIENEKVSLDITYKEDFLNIKLEMSGTKNYKVDLKNFQSKRLNIE